ncbi:MAG TPA: response regulator [Gemmatimonadaceae bacterium]
MNDASDMLSLVPAEHGAAGASRVLLVEGDAAEVRRLEEALAAVTQGPGGARLRLDVSSRLDDAIALLERTPVDAVLLDLALPDAPGLTALERLHRAAPETPIIVLGALTDEAMAVDALRRGAEDYLIKAEIDERLVVRALRYGIERHRARQRLRQILRTAIDGFWIVDLEGRILEVNDAYCRMSGYSREELLRMRVSDVADADEGQIRANIAQIVARGGARIETRHRTKDGRLLDLELASTFHPSSATCFTFLRDVSERKRAEGAMREAETLAAIGRLVSGVAHELNNPLAAILLFSDALLQEDGRTESDLEALRAINAQAQRSGAIVRDLLSAVRAREEQREHLDGRAIVAESAEALRQLVERGGARLELALADEEAPLFADRIALEQVLTNLVTNAAQAAGEGGTVRVAARRDGGVYRITVEDDGPGIPPDLIPRIFEPFFTTRPAGQGTGLGLSVSLGIVRQHGGQLEVDRRQVRGTCLVVTLPIASPADPPPVAPATSAPAVPATPAAAPDAHAGPSRILVIDDEPSIRAALRRFLSRRGWAVDEAAEGAAALEKLHATPPNGGYAVILSDLKMPGVSGVELHDRLAAEGSPYLSRLILSTGDLASAEASSFVERTACRVLQKPYELAALAEILEGMKAGAAR